MIKPEIPIGTVHGRLTILAFEQDPLDPRHPKYRCQCSCGAIKLIQRGNLERTHSCGCIKVEMLKAKATHGMRHTPEYRIWADMIRRCSHPNSTAHANYGGRGITVCQRWVNSFIDFHLDMGDRPSPKHTIDRIDNDGNYEPSNCRWATRKQQRDNQRRSIEYTYDGFTGSLKDLARHFNLSYSMLHQRVRVAGWTLSRAILTPSLRQDSNSTS